MHKWASTATSDNGTWLEGLRGFTPQQVVKGIRRIESGYYEWPPTLPEFKLICLGLDHQEAHEMAKKIVLSQLTSHERKRLTHAKQEQLLSLYRRAALDQLVMNMIVGQQPGRDGLLEHRPADETQPLRLHTGE